MKPTAILSLLGASMLTAGLYACSETKDNNDNIEFTRLRSVAAYSQKVDDSQPAQRIACKADMLMPVGIYGQDITPLVNSIRMSAFDSDDGNSAVADYFKKSADEFGYASTPLDLTANDISSLKNEPSALSNYDGFVTVTGYVQTITPKILSYAIEKSSYAPRAAHGMYGTTYINYDMRSGNIVTLQDIFIADSLASIPSIIRDKASQMASTLGETEIESVPADGNFTITPDGYIVFSYRPYEVASYAQGEIRVPIAAYTIDSYLSGYGKTILLGE